MSCDGQIKAATAGHCSCLVITLVILSSVGDEALLSFFLIRLQIHSELSGTICLTVGVNAPDGDFVAKKKFSPILLVSFPANFSSSQQQLALHILLC